MIQSIAQSYTQDIQKRKRHTRGVKIPIEILWEHLDRNVRNLGPSSQEEMWKNWSDISQDTINKLIARMPRVVNKIIY